MTAPVDVTVSVVNWNRRELLARCLASVQASEGVSLETIVVDNASSDGSAGMVRQRFPAARLVANAANVGFGRAHNQAVGLARGRYVLVLNNDAAVEPGTVRTLVEFMDAQPDVGIAGCPGYRDGLGEVPTGQGFADQPSLRDVTLWNLWVAFRPPARWARRAPEFVRARVVDAGAGETDVAWITGALLVLRRAMLARIGAFDERFFMYGEDWDLCRRARADGWRVVVTGRTRYRHEGGASGALRRDIEAVRRRGCAQYFRKHHGTLAGVLYHAQHAVLREGVAGARVRVSQAVRLAAHWLGGGKEAGMGGEGVSR